MKRILVFCLIILLLTGSPLLAASYQRREDAKNPRGEASMMEVNDELEKLIELHAPQAGEPDSKQKVEGLDAPNETTFADTEGDLRGEADLEQLSKEMEKIIELYATQAGGPNAEQELNGRDASRETMFVTGAEGDLYEDPEDIQAAMPYLHYRSSDGAIFVGTLTYYYLAAGYLSPSQPSVKCYQALYEGTLTLQHYVD